MADKSPWPDVSESLNVARVLARDDAPHWVLGARSNDSWKVNEGWQCRIQTWSSAAPIALLVLSST